MIVDRRHTWRLAGRLVCLLLFCMVLTACDRAADLQEAERRLTADIPDDATPAQVLRYLDSQKVEHSGYEKLGLREHSIHAVIRERIHWHTIERDYAAEYRFSEHGSLVEKIVTVKYGVIGSG
jgi:hypothetical protein